MKEYLATDTLYYIIGIIILAVAIVVVWRKTFKKELKSIKALESKDKWIIRSYIGIPIIAIIADVGLRIFLHQPNCPVGALNGHGIEILLAQLSINFITITVLSIFSDNEEIIYWVNMVKERLIEPPATCFKAYFYYTVFLQMYAVICLLSGSKLAFISVIALNVICLFRLTYIMISCYYQDDEEEKKVLEDGKITIIDGNEDKIEKLFEDFLRYTNKAYVDGDYYTVSKNLDAYDELFGIWGNEEGVTEKLCEIVKSFYDNKTITGIAKLFSQVIPDPKGFETLPVVNYEDAKEKVKDIDFLKEQAKACENLKTKIGVFGESEFDKDKFDELPCVKAINALIDKRHNTAFFDENAKLDTEILYMTVKLYLVCQYAEKVYGIKRSLGKEKSYKFKLVPFIQPKTRESIYNVIFAYINNVDISIICKETSAVVCDMLPKFDEFCTALDGADPETFGIDPVREAPSAPYFIDYYAKLGDISKSIFRITKDIINEFVFQRYFNIYDADLLKRLDKEANDYLLNKLGLTEATWKCLNNYESDFTDQLKERYMNELGISEEDAEEMAEYLNTMLDSIDA